jgi:CheY-like chemotaxis protein
MADILIVDDEADLASLLKMIFECDGHDCRVASNGRDGLALIADGIPDLVLLDLDMPIMTGAEMAHMLLVQNCGREKIPIILLSGSIHLGRIAAAIGTPYFLAKPYTLERVREIVARALVERTPPRPGKES